jgi:hypothetical protein
LLALAAVPNAGPAIAQSPPVVQQQTPAEFLETIRDALRRWAQAEDNQAEAASRELLALYEQLGTNDRLPSTLREQYRGKIRGRLEKLAEQIGRTVSPPVQAPPRQRPPVAGTMNAVDAVIGQIGAMRRPATTAPYATESGEALIDMIQRTIAPESWDVNGGRGSIFYWAPGQALIVRQSYAP